MKSRLIDITCAFRSPIYITSFVCHSNVILFGSVIHDNSKYPLDVALIVSVTRRFNFDIFDNTYRQPFNESRTKSHNLNVSRLVLQLSLPNPLKRGVE